jgi:hypothetical protein
MGTSADGRIQARKGETDAEGPTKVIEFPRYLTAIADREMKFLSRSEFIEFVRDRKEGEVHFVGIVLFADFTAGLATPAMRRELAQAAGFEIMRGKQ